MAPPDTPQDILRIFEKTEKDSRAWTLDALPSQSGIRRLMFLNAHAVNMAANRPDFGQILLNSDGLLRDGIGVELAFRALELQPTENLNGTDLIPKIINRLKDRKIAVWGSSEEALEKLRQRLEGEGFANLAPMHHGFHDDAFYIDEFAKTRPEVIVLCMGMPRQEVLAAKLILPAHDCLIVCGGGWANFYSGHTKRAPVWVQRLKMEWMHRLASDPVRLGKRYTVDILSYFRIVHRVRNAKRTR